MKKQITFLLLLITVGVFAQEKLTLDNCYLLVEKNYPINAQRDLLTKQKDIDISVINTKKLPEFNVDAQATYQSDVIGLPLPNVTPLNNDQYKATLTANQLIYGGNSINKLIAKKNAELKTKQQEIEVNLYQLKKEINQLYFSALLIQKKEDLLNNKKELLNTKLAEVKSGIRNGVLLPASDVVLETELAKVEQQFVTLASSKEIIVNTLSSLTKQEIDPNTEFVNPILQKNEGTEISRPEQKLFQLKKEEIETAEKLLAIKNSPKLIGFATGGYGNPGLNLLDNSYQGFYIVGLKFNWKIFDWKANKKERKSLLLNKEFITNQSEIFELNTNIEIEKQEAEIKKLEKLITSDHSIIDLRKKVLNTTASQLKNGVITASAYVTELSNLYEDENTLSTHQIELLLAQANYNVTKGN